MAKKEFNVDKFIKNTTVFFICLICLIGCVMVLYRMKNPKKVVDSFSGTLNINQDNLDTFMRQISIIDPLISTSKIDVKKISDDRKLLLATDKILADNGNPSTMTFNKGKIKNNVGSILGIDNFNYYPEAYSYLNYIFKFENDQYVMSKTDDIDYGYVYASDNFTLEGKILSFTADILYYRYGNKYYTDSTMKNLICEGESTCVSETAGYTAKGLKATYYINGDNFILQSIDVN